MSFPIGSGHLSLSADLAELQRNVHALEANSSRPHKQLVQRGTFVYTTGNVASLPLSSRADHSRPSSVLAEIEQAIAVNAKGKAPLPSWQANEPAVERAQLAITAKVFVKPDSSSANQDIEDVIRAALVELAATHIDTLILAVPADSTVDAIVPIWSVLENLHRVGAVAELGISNADAAQVAALLSSASVAPSVVQINTRSVDKELVCLARARGIRALADPDTDAHLLVSSDKAEGSHTFGQSFDRVLVPPFSKTSFKPLAALRYTSVIHERGVVSARGYSVKSRYTIQ